MPDLWGPGAFGADLPAATRPAYTPTNGAGDPDSWYQDCSSPTAADGTEWRSAALNILLAQLRGVVRSGSSVSPTNLDDLLLAKAMVSGHATYAVATGTANAWTVAPALAVPAYAAGRVLNIVAPATNTSTTVNMAVSGLASRRIKKSDGTDPAVGDLVSGKVYATIDDGTSIRILTLLPSDIVAALSAAPSPPQLNFFDLTTQHTQNVGSSVVTVVTDFAVTASKASDAAFSAGGTVTIGAKTAGVWSFSQTYIPSQVGAAPSIVQAYLQKNGVNVQNQTVTGTFCTNAGVVRVAAGDTLRMAVWQNSGSTQKNQHAPALPQTTTFNLYQISS